MAADLIFTNPNCDRIYPTKEKEDPVIWFNIKINNKVSHLSLDLETAAAFANQILQIVKEAKNG